ncbi:phage tail tape measure protein [Pseudomonas lalucatii]|nr:phage tail tape measure protein [Pseudomonas lalucatii]
MARDLKLEVVLHALDRASRPFKAIAGSGVGLARTLRDTRGELKGLQAQQKDIASFRSLKGASEQTASALQANRDTLRQLSRELAGHERTLAPLQASYDALSAESNTLADKHQALTKQLRLARQESRTANQVWQENRKRIRELGQQLGNTAQPTQKLRDEYAQLVAKQKDQLVLVRRLGDEQKALAQQHRASSASTKQTKERVAELATQLREARTPLQALNQAFRSNLREGHALKAKHAEQQRELQGLRGQLNAAGISTRTLGQHERDLRGKINQTNQALALQEARLKRVTAQQQRLAKAKGQYDATQALAGSMAANGAGGLAAGSGILYSGARLLAPGLDFDASMSKVQALTRLAKDDPQLQALRDQARALGASTQFTAGQAADAQGFLGMAGFDPKAIQAAMPGMLALAKAGDSDLAETADIASNILTGFNLQAGETGRLGDVLVGTFTRSNTNLQMLGETMKYVAPVAAGVGQDIETVAAMAGKLGDAGIQGSMGGTALRAIISRLAEPPKMAAKALAKLGVEAKDAQGNLRDLPSVLAELHSKTKALGNADRAGFFKAIAGEEAFSGLQVLVDQAGSGKLQQFIGTLRQAQGEAETTAKVMADNLRGDLDSLGSAWEDLGIQLQDQQNGPLRGLTQGLTRVIGSVKGWIAENPELAGQIVKTAAGIGLLMAGMGGLTLAMASILGPFAMVRFGMMLLGIKSLGLGQGLLWLGRTVLPLVGKGLLLIGRALMLNPIGLAITAIAGGAYLIYRNWDKVGPYFQGLWGEIKAGFSGGLAGIATTLLNFSPLGLLYRAFAGVMGYLGVELPGKFSEFGGMLMTGLANGIRNALGSVKTAVLDAGDSAIGYFKEKLGIHSPSRVFAELGGHTMAGLSQGLERGQGGPWPPSAASASNWPRPAL